MPGARAEGLTVVRKLRIPENLTTLAYRTIKTYIWEGRLDTGEHLTEESLSRQLGISKSPVREALNRLESEGLIRIESRKGAFLPRHTIKDVEDLYGLREALETHAVATAKVTPELVEALWRSVDHARDFLAANDKRQHIEEDVRFHALLASAAGNPLLARTVENVLHQIWIFRRASYDLSRSIAVATHSIIVTALEQGDRAAAVRAIREHIAAARGELAGCFVMPEPKSGHAIARPRDVAVGEESAML